MMIDVEERRLVIFIVLALRLCMSVAPRVTSGLCSRE